MNVKFVKIFSNDYFSLKNQSIVIKIYLPMRPNQVSSSDHLAVIRACIILLLLLYSTTMLSQSQVNFSGKWTYDKTKSTTGTNNSEYPGTITREITQTDSKLTYRDIYINSGSNPFTSSDIVLNLDGKEEIDKSDPDVTLAKSLKWLQGNKSFTLTFKTKYKMDGVFKEILINDTYTLSDDGKTLTIIGFRKAELGETKTTEVYNKK